MQKSVIEQMIENPFQDSYEFREHFLTSEANRLATKRQNSFLTQECEPFFMN